MIRRPDKEDNIRIEALGEAPQGQGPQQKKSYPPRREAGAVERGPRHHDGPRHEPVRQAVRKTSRRQGRGFEDKTAASGQARLRRKAAL